MRNPSANRRSARKQSNDSNLILIVVVAAIMIISAIIVFETRPQRDERVGVICNNCSYDVNEKPSYTDKLLDPVSIFTLFLVISTVALWRSTERLASIASDQSEDIRESLAIAERSANAAKKAADAASIQATAAISVEQPIIFAGNIAVNPLNTGFAIYSTGLPEYPIASIRFHNYGRTPAEILGYSIVPKIIKRLPEVRGDPDIFQVAPGTIIKPDDWLSFPYIFQWSEAERRGIVESETRLWIYGIIAYKDFLDNRHEVGFCSMAIPREDNKLNFVFSSDTPPAYVYRKSY